MTTLLLHNSTKQAVDNFVHMPSHGLLIVGPTGSGKFSLAQLIASNFTNLPKDKLDSYPYFKHVRSINDKAISIDDIRDIIHFMTRKTVGTSSAISRIAIIENAHRMTLQAQNALLKTIEEPPTGTAIILTATNELSLLPTIRSRVQQVSVLLPASQTTKHYFEELGHASDAVQKALLMSGGLPGLMRALLEADTEHPLITATNFAREILQKDTFERLILIDELAKQKQTWLNVLFMLEQMSDIAMRQNAQDERKVRRWQQVLAACHRATEQTMMNGQLKLVLTNFMLTL